MNECRKLATVVTVAVLNRGVLLYRPRGESLQLRYLRFPESYPQVEFPRVIRHRQR
jgi:hypothetical protein